ncbi:MAG: hypothetical protein JO199_08395 [Candidatus Eremiobacteraeota bacterium]|nr:hypothetical protein [Candidatus Eremiobacteraeota bacterium]
MKLEEFDLRLYGLLRRCLRKGASSTAADPLTPELRSALVDNFDRLRVGELCGCGDSDCRSFKSQAFKREDGLRRIRFIVNGELHVLCDDNGVIHRVVWFPGDATAPPSHAYAATSDGWVELPIEP